MLELSELSPALGVRVEGLDQRLTLRAEEVEVLDDALARHHLLCLHAPDLEAEDHLRFASHFGPLLSERRGEDRESYVSNLRADGIIQEGALLFHSDLAFTDEPLLGLSLYAIEVPPGGTTTRYANATRAWSQLDASMRSRLHDLHARHGFDLSTERGDRPYRETGVPEGQPVAVHPVRWVSPLSGDCVLYVNEMQTLEIQELPRAASDELLEELFGVLYAPGNVYEHHWQQGDLLLWDNRALQHARDAPPAEPRTLRRVTLARKGVAEQIEGFVMPG